MVYGVLPTQDHTHIQRANFPPESLQQQKNEVNINGLTIQDCLLSTSIFDFLVEQVRFVDGKSKSDGQCKEKEKKQQRERLSFSYRYRLAIPHS